MAVKLSGAGNMLQLLPKCGGSHWDTCVVSRETNREVFCVSLYLVISFISFIFEY